MKRFTKILSLLLALCTVLPVLVSCGGSDDTTTEGTATSEHECSFSWQYDPYGHWQACSVSGCTVTKDKTDHEYGDKSTTTDGDQITITKTCQVCGYQNVEKGATELILTFEDVVNALYEGAVTFANVDAAYDEGKKYFYFLY